MSRARKGCKGCHLVFLSGFGCSNCTFDNYSKLAYFSRWTEMFQFCNILFMVTAGTVMVHMARLACNSHLHSVGEGL